MTKKQREKPFISPSMCKSFPAVGRQGECQMPASSPPSNWLLFLLPPSSIRAAAETVASWWVLMALRPAAIHAGLYMHCCHFPVMNARRPLWQLPTARWEERKKDRDVGRETERRWCLSLHESNRDNAESLLFLYFMRMPVSLSPFPFISCHCCLFVARDERDGGEEEQTSSGGQ